MSSSIIRLAFHAFGFLHHTVVLTFMLTIDFHRHNIHKVIEMTEYSFGYFTFWNFTIQLIFMALSVVCDVGVLWPDLFEKLSPKSIYLNTTMKMRDFLFNTFVFPFTIITAGLFWMVFLYDRELVMPIEFDLFIPSQANHCIHSNIIIVIFLELILGEKKALPFTRTQSFSCLGLFILSYYAAFLCIYWMSGRWIYIIFYTWNWTQRMIFFASLYILTNSVMYAGLLLQDVIHGKETVRTEKDVIKEEKCQEHENYTYKNEINWKQWDNIIKRLSAIQSLKS